MNKVITLDIPKNPHTREIRIVKKLRETINITSPAARQPEGNGWNLGDDWHLLSAPVEQFEKTIAKRYELFNNAREVSIEEQEHIRTTVLRSLNLAPCIQSA